MVEVVEREGEDEEEEETKVIKKIKFDNIELAIYQK